VRLARAIEAGIPVVASSVRGLDGYLDHGVTGIAVQPGDISKLRNAVDALVASPQERQALRINAYEAMRPRTLAAFIRQIETFCLSDKPGFRASNSQSQ
jgi:glycosyltransferase involved in cell wall biosynthesis